METMLEYWLPVFTEESVVMEEYDNINIREDLLILLAPVSTSDVAKISIPSNSAAGLDGISDKEWEAVPKCMKACFFNLILAIAGFPEDLLASRTVFIPKKNNPEDPSDFRPIMIGSVVVRHLHKIISSILIDAGVIDERQRSL